MHRLLLSLTIVAALTACGPAMTPAPVLNVGFRGDSSTGGMIVGSNDTLWAISQRYRLPLRSIIELNDLQPPYRLAAGQRLKLPAPLDYTAKPGDNVRSIANTFGVSVTDLVKVNNLPAPYKLRYAQVLRIPATYNKETAARIDMAIQQDVAAEPLSVPSAKPEAVVSEELSPPPAEPVEKMVLGVPVPSSTTRKPVQQAESSTPALPFKRPSFIWPVRGKVISGYGAKDGGLFNDGINIAVPKGTPVTSAAEGIVAYVGNDLKSYGNLILIRHSGGTMTAYAHLASVRIKKGATVRKGQVIGTAGSTGSVPSSQLHFEVRQGAKTLDPRLVLG